MAERTARLTDVNKDMVTEIAADHPIFRSGVKEILGREKDVELIGEPDNGHKALELARKQRWDVIVLDITMSGKGGLEVSEELRRKQPKLPVLVLSAHPEDPLALRSIKAGAFEFLTKPFREQALLNAIEGALTMTGWREMELKLANLRMRYESVTPREREVMSHVIAGLLNKQIGAKLDIVEKTIKFHRAHLMEKMRAGSPAELVRMAANLGVLAPKA